MNVPEIQKMKQQFDALQQAQLLQQWELPYENILTRLTAAIFFVQPAEGVSIDRVAEEFSNAENFSWRKNSELKLSQLPYRITFSKEEKEKNLQSQFPAHETAS